MPLLLIPLVVFEVFLFNLIWKKWKNMTIRFLGQIIVLISIGIALYMIPVFLFKDVSMGEKVLKSGGIFVALFTFAAQKTLNNIIAGFSITVCKPFKIGDKIQITRYGSVIAEGVVKDLNLRHVILETFDEKLCMVPNGVIAESSVENVNSISGACHFLEFTMADSDHIDWLIDKAIKICQEEKLCTSFTTPQVSDISKTDVTVKILIRSDTIDNCFKACSFCNLVI